MLSADVPEFVPGGRRGGAGGRPHTTHPPRHTQHNNWKSDRPNYRSFDKRDKFGMRNDSDSPNQRNYLEDNWRQRDMGGNVWDQRKYTVTNAGSGRSDKRTQETNMKGIKGREKVWDENRANREIGQNRIKTSSAKGKPPREWKERSVDDRKSQNKTSNANTSEGKQNTRVNDGTREKDSSSVVTSLCKPGVSYGRIVSGKVFPSDPPGDGKASGVYQGGMGEQWPSLSGPRKDLHNQAPMSHKAEVDVSIDQSRDVGSNDFPSKEFKDKGRRHEDSKDHLEKINNVDKNFVETTDKTDRNVNRLPESNSKIVKSKDQTNNPSVNQFEWQVKEKRKKVPKAQKEEMSPLTTKGKSKMQDDKEKNKPGRNGVNQGKMVSNSSKNEDQISGQAIAPSSGEVQPNEEKKKSRMTEEYKLRLKEKKKQLKEEKKLQRERKLLEERRMKLRNTKVSVITKELIDYLNNSGGQQSSRGPAPRRDRPPATKTKDTTNHKPDTRLKHNTAHTAPGTLNYSRVVQMAPKKNNGASKEEAVQIEPFEEEKRKNVKMRDPMEFDLFAALQTKMKSKQKGNKRDGMHDTSMDNETLGAAAPIKSQKKVLRRGKQREGGPRRRLTTLKKRMQKARLAEAQNLLDVLQEAKRLQELTLEQRSAGSTPTSDQDSIARELKTLSLEDDTLATHAGGTQQPSPAILVTQDQIIKDPRAEKPSANTANHAPNNATANTEKQLIQEHDSNPVIESSEADKQVSSEVSESQGVMIARLMDAETSEKCRLLTEDLRHLMVSHPKVREYCDHDITPEVNAGLKTFLETLVRFQDRKYQQDPVKARSKRRYVCGLKETVKHMHKMACVVVASNIQRSVGPGLLDEQVEKVLSGARSKGVPIIFGLSVNKLGRVCHKAHASCVGVINYQGAQASFNHLMELVPEAKRKYQALDRPAEVDEE